MAIQIFNDGSCIRIEKNGKILLVSKEQVKTIDTVHENIVRIDIGEGPLKNIFLNYQEVTAPVVASADNLRDEIKGMMVSDQYDGGDATEQTQLQILSQVQTLADNVSRLYLIEQDCDRRQPTRVDESRPNLVYKGWHNGVGNPAAEEWAIMRIQNVNDSLLYDWAYGQQIFISAWDNRENLNYAPINFSTAN